MNEPQQTATTASETNIRPREIEAVFGYIKLGILEWLWLGVALAVGVGLNIYGLFWAVPDAFNMAFVLYAVALLPIVIHIIGRLLRLALVEKTISTILAVAVAISLVIIIMYRYRVSVSVNFKNLLTIITDPTGARVVIVFIIAISGIVMLGIIGLVLANYIKSFFEVATVAREADHDLNITELEAETDLEKRRLELEHAIGIKKLELEEKKLVLESERLKIAAAKPEQLLTHEAAPAVPAKKDDAS